MYAIFCSPSRYTQGPDATQALGAELSTLRLSGPVLVVTSRSPRARLEPTWRTSLGGAGYVMRLHEVVGECTHAEIARIAAAATAAGCGVIVGAGGGKVLDAARAAAVQLQLPFVSCPTIASTDAPCSALSVVYDEAGVFVEYLIHSVNPVLVLVDSRVIAEAPTRLLVAGMGDALSTMFEARACSTAQRPNTRGGACGAQRSHGGAGHARLPAWREGRVRRAGPATARRGGADARERGDRLLSRGGAAHDAGGHRVRRSLRVAGPAGRRSRRHGGRDDPQRTIPGDGRACGGGDSCGGRGGPRRRLTRAWGEQAFNAGHGGIVADGLASVPTASRQAR